MGPIQKGLTKLIGEVPLCKNAEQLMLPRLVIQCSVREYERIFRFAYDCDKSEACVVTVFPAGAETTLFVFAFIEDGRLLNVAFETIVQ